MEKEKVPPECHDGDIVESKVYEFPRDRANYRGKIVGQIVNKAPLSGLVLVRVTKVIDGINEISVGSLLRINNRTIQVIDENN